MIPTWWPAVRATTAVGGLLLLSSSLIEPREAMAQQRPQPQQARPQPRAQQPQSRPQQPRAQQQRPQQQSRQQQPRAQQQSRPQQPQARQPRQPLQRSPQQQQQRQATPQQPRQGTQQQPRSLNQPANQLQTRPQGPGGAGGIQGRQLQGAGGAGGVAPRNPALPPTRLPPARSIGGNFQRLAPNVGRVPTRGGSVAQIPGAGRIPTAHRALPVVARGPNFRHGPGRIAVPRGIPPRHTFARIPPAHFHGRFFPFVQRSWRGPIFWTFVAGVGFLTIPQLYYSTFVEYVNVERYDEAVLLLSEASIEEEDESYVVRQRPASVVYKYRATVAPVVAEEKECFLKHFVDRVWNAEFVSVAIPIDGVESNVTVPVDYYDAFVAEVGKPDYATSCRILVEAAARDTTPAADIGDPEASQVQ